MNDCFVFDGNTSAIADAAMHNDTVQKLWHSFCLNDGTLTLQKGEPLVFRMGALAPPSLPDGKEYALCVTEAGAAVIGKDYGGLMRGFCSLLMKIEQAGERFMIKAVTEESSYTIANRMIHICVFPENDLYFIKKLIRLAGLCQYTHIVIEFWGMLQYDCLKELAWPHAFTKAQAKELVQEARELGLEPIPMFNQFGHATASTIRFGKHVVLDQNPRLQHLFTPDGWAWDIDSDRVYELFRSVRTELYEVFGTGEYMHLGCDEAYYYKNCAPKHPGLPTFLKRLTEDVVREGRRPMVWMDMLLDREKYPRPLKATCDSADVQIFTDALAPETVMVDWQYNVTEAPVRTMRDLKQTGHDVIGAPWLDPENYKAVADTVTENALFGIMLTTWHTLKTQMTGVLDCAKHMGVVTFPWSEYSGPHEETATMLRRVSFAGNDYHSSGWAKEQFEV